MNILGVFGTIDPIDTYAPGYNTIGQGGLSNFISIILTLITIVAGLATVISFILAGYGYITAEGNAQKLTNAGNKMTQAVIGLLILASAYVIAGIIGYLFFKDSTFLINPVFQKIY